MDSHYEIVLIEDNPIDAELALKGLKKSGIEARVRLIHDGAEALDYFFGTGKYSKREAFLLPKMVLLDLKIPKVSGLEVLELIRSNRFTKTIPIIIFSSSLVQKDIDEAYKKGANSYLTKPMNYGDYCRLLNTVCEYWLTNNITAY